MKKILAFIILCLVLVSCSTTALHRQNTGYTEDEALFAVKEAARALEENASKTFYNNLFSSETFIPKQYQILETMKKEIPGMNRILNEFKLYYSTLVLNSINTLFTFTSKNISELQFEYPQFYVISSNTSISDYFITLYSRDISAIIKNMLKDADYSLLKEAINTFNTYIKVKSLKFDPLKETDFNTLYSDYITEKYISVLKKSEELFRTTPSPYADDTVKKVFGNY